ncbi:polyamine ABC transporter substrate-binding protein [Paractinoplanes globisporus]|uniref:Spermidine/putrescine ABC transporter substrate-binding protein n=1 Tax=Paractinoplanes globisporus TaxID=113565 RepID=A0ABW6WCE1_9ACTN|nr:spermidine/putrescine ABC transporter substrate-binding protein [Actinoplanes globisporus]
MDRRDLLKLAGLLGGATALGGCGFAQTEAPAAAEESQAPPIEMKVDGDLVYFNWADYIDPDVKAGFAKEYGVKVIESNFDSMESMTAKLTAGNAYDVIFPSDKFAERLVKAGKLRAIDHAQLTNSEKVFGTYDYFQNPWYDQNSAHTIPNTMYKTGIGWRKDKLGAKLTGSWNDLWDTRANGKKFLLDDRDEVLGLAALRLGYDINTAKPDELDKMVALIKDLRPHLRGFSSDTTHNLSGGSSWLQQMWSGDIVAVIGQADKPELYGFESPTEGAPTGSDTYAIPVDAKHPGTAMLFIDYMLRPENAIKNIEYIGYPMPIKGTEQAYAKLVEPVPESVVTVDDLAKAINFHNGTAEETQARDAAYTEIKAA